MILVPFSPNQVADLWDSQKPFSPSRISLEVLVRLAFQECDAIELEGITFGGHRVALGRLVFIQRGLVLFVAGSGLCEDDPKYNFVDLRLCSGIARRKPGRGLFEVERFAVMQASTARMDVIASRPRTHQYLDGMAGYMICGVGRNESELPVYGLEQELWDQIVALLDRYLEPVT